MVEGHEKTGSDKSDAATEEEAKAEGDSTEEKSKETTGEEKDYSNKGDEDDTAKKENQDLEVVWLSSILELSTCERGAFTFLLLLRVKGLGIILHIRGFSPISNLAVLID